MVRVQLDRVSIDLPVLGRQASSLKQTILSTATGGALGLKGGVTIVSALQDVTLDLRQGDRLGVVGHNGAGKTTLLR
ncbi:MAG: ATP-binding cassette domain-containing protein, partial [Phycisphaerales bacterium]